MKKKVRGVASVLVGVGLMLFGATGNLGVKLIPGYSESVFADDGNGDGIDDQTGQPVAQAESNSNGATAGSNYTTNTGCGEGEIKTAILGGTSGCYKVGNDGEAIFALLARVLTILTYGVGTLGVFGIVVCGVQYTLAGGDVGKMTKAKQRIVEVVIGLVCWGLLYSFLQWIIPGGVL